MTCEKIKIAISSDYKLFLCYNRNGDNMKTIKATSVNEIVINKSIFITTLFRVNSIDEVNNYLQITRKKYYDATHNCYAYILGQKSEIQKASDDGEPQKTAGMPMLDVLKKRQMTNILAITTRYFGGILLGAGGLIRAYSSSVSEALNKMDIYEYLDYEKLCVNVSYPTYNIIEGHLKKYTIFNTEYSDCVKVYVGIEPSQVIKFKEEITNLTNGRLEISSLGIQTEEILVEHNES